MELRVKWCDRSVSSPLQLFVPAGQTSSSARTAPVSTAADSATACVIVQMAPTKSTAKTVSVQPEVMSSRTNVHGVATLQNVSTNEVIFASAFRHSCMSWGKICSINTII